MDENYSKYMNTFMLTCVYQLQTLKNNYVILVTL